MDSFFAACEKRLFVCYGLTRDRFCPPDSTLLKFDELLHQHLKEKDYDQILFYGHVGLYFMDPVSRDSVIQPSINQAVPARPSPLSHLSPGGFSLRKAKSGASISPTGSSTPPSDGGTLCYPNLPATELVGLIRRHMLDQSRSTAVIFNSDHLHSFDRNPETAQFFRGVLETDIRTLPAGNRNIMIFVFGMELDATIAHVQGKPWDILLPRKEGDSVRQGIAQMVHVGCPEQDEVFRLIHHYRLMRGLSIDWLQQDHMVRILTAWLRGKDPQKGESVVGLKELESWQEELVRRKETLNIAQIQKKSSQERGVITARKRLAELEGLDGIKEWIDDHIELARDLMGHGQGNRMQDSERMQDLNRTLCRRLMIHRGTGIVPDVGMLHLALVGNPGTGKTTVARLIGEIFRDAGILELGHTVTCTRKDLVGQFVGLTAIKTRERIDEAMGGVLFIDEAYELARGGENDYGHEAVTEIIAAMSDLKGRFMVVLAGYPADIKTLIESNPGFQRRIHTIELPDYTPEVLERIFRNLCRESLPPLDLDDEVDQALPEFFDALHRRRDPNFGNAGTVKNDIFEEVRRKSDRTNDGRRILRKCHFPEKYQSCFEPRQMAPLAQLNRMIGLSRVKQQVQGLIQLKRLEQQRALQNGAKASVSVPGHYLFAGNPGTGKTTVARLMGEQFSQIGLLERGHLVEVTATELSGTFLGHSEEKTRDILEKSLGGVCFVDEAHQLINPHGYGKQAINVMVPFLSAHKHEFCMILAGYPHDMEGLIQADPGLRRRFPTTIHFHDYDADELARIFHLMADDDGLSMTADATTVLNILIEEILRHKTRGFGNAGVMENLLQVAKMNMAGRLDCESPTNTDTDTDMDADTAIDFNILTDQDIPSLDSIKESI